MASVLLPLKQSSAQAILDQYANKVAAYVGADAVEQAESSLMHDLNILLESCKQISLSMLRAMGYSGGSVETSEQNLQQVLQQVQKETSFFNGKGLYDFILKDIEEAAVYSSEVQKHYEEWCFENFGTKERDELAKIGLEQIGEKLLKLYPETITVSTASNKTSFIGNNKYVMFQGRNAGHKFTGSVILNKQDPLDFSRFTSKMLDNFRKQGIKDVKTENEFDNSGQQVVFGIPVTQSNVASFLKLTYSNSSKGNKQDTIESLLKLDPQIINKVRLVLKEKILQAAVGVSDKSLFEKCIDDVIFNEAYTKDLFSGSNAQKKITGVFGELQALYFIRRILRKNKVEGLSQAHALGGKNEHPDLILESVIDWIFHDRVEQYGIQVKNTRLETAEYEVFFESFSSGKLPQDLVGVSGDHFKFDWNNAFKNLSKDIESNIFAIYKDPTLQQAIIQLQALNDWNVSYIHEGKKYKEGKNEAFAETRKRIEDAAANAQKAAVIFAASALYMQTTSALTGKKANTLYIIAGQLVITSYSILKDIIKNLENDSQRFKIRIGAMSKKKGSKYGKSMDNIVDFFNLGSGYGRSIKATLTSSYNFQL